MFFVLVFVLDEKNYSFWGVLKILKGFVDPLRKIRTHLRKEHS